MLRHRVTAGHVTVETAVSGGRALIDVFRGELVPLDVPKEQIDWELQLGTIEPTEVDEHEPSDQDSDMDKTDGNGEGAGGEPEPIVLPPGMSVATTLEWVGEDAGKAKAALAAEVGEDGNGRNTLIDRLQKVIAAAEAAAAEAAEREGAGAGENSGAGPSVDS
jgi:hypothetical protein